MYNMVNKLHDIINCDEDFIIYQDLVRDILYDENRFKDITTERLVIEDPIFECDNYSIVKIDKEYKNYYIIKYSSYVKESYGFNEGTYLIYVKPKYISNYTSRSSS